jgi:2-C-methyl-D-erythritol 4-phosphate cytidylyltransferase
MGAVRHAAIVLAAGKGSRMQTDTPKQYLELNQKPLLFYALRGFENSFVDEIVLVTGPGQEAYCRSEIVEKYGFQKVKKIVTGGKERYDSVYQGLLALQGADYVYIHDGARPFVTSDILERAKACVMEFDACVAGMPVKDTIKLADGNNFVAQTPPRDQVWMIQTPQVFSYALIREAYERLYQAKQTVAVTDDAMVVESMMHVPVKLFQGSYENIKITTPEDLRIAKALMTK